MPLSHGAIFLYSGVLHVAHQTLEKTFVAFPKVFDIREFQIPCPKGKFTELGILFNSRMIANKNQPYIR